MDRSRSYDPFRERCRRLRFKGTVFTFPFTGFRLVGSCGGLHDAHVIHPCGCRNARHKANPSLKGHSPFATLRSVSHDLPSPRRFPCVLQPDPNGRLSLPQAGDRKETDSSAWRGILTRGIDREPGVLIPGSAVGVSPADCGPVPSGSGRRPAGAAGLRRSSCRHRPHSCRS